MKSTVLRLRNFLRNTVRTKSCGSIYFTKQILLASVNTSSESPIIISLDTRQALPATHSSPSSTIIIDKQTVSSSAGDNSLPHVTLDHLDSGPSDYHVSDNSKHKSVCSSDAVAEQRQETVDEDAEEEVPLYVNAKQYQRILKRRLARQRLAELSRLSKSRKVGPMFLPSRIIAVIDF